MSAHCSSDAVATIAGAPFIVNLGSSSIADGRFDAVARAHLANALRTGVRQSYDWQVRRFYVSQTGAQRDAQVMAGTRADCAVGASRWARATGEYVEVVPNNDGDPAIAEFPPFA